MKLLWLIGVSILCATAVADDPNEQSKEIPLDEIWAYRMPGTRDVYDLEPKIDLNSFVDELTFRREMARRSDVWKISEVLGEFPKEGTKAGSAFVVVGTGKEALKKAAAVITDAKKKDEPRTVFLPDTDLSLVFYSRLCGRYVHLVSVEQSAGLITVKYRFVLHAEQIMRWHLALIPLGKLDEGEVQVEVEQLPPINWRGEHVWRGAARPAHE